MTADLIGGTFMVLFVALFASLCIGWVIRVLMGMFPAKTPPLPLHGQCYVVPGIGVVRVTGSGPSKVHYTHSDGANAFATIADWRAYNPTLITTRAEALLEATREVEEILNAD